MHIKKNNKAF